MHSSRSDPIFSIFCVQGLDQAISGRADLLAAVVAVGAGSVSGGLAAKLLPTKGRLPDLLTPRTSKNIGPNSLRMIGQESGSDAIASVAGLAVPAESRPCGCK